jgi:hypothetical protein
MTFRLDIPLTTDLIVFNL